MKEAYTPLFLERDTKYMLKTRDPPSGRVEYKPCLRSDSLFKDIGEARQVSGL